jgi:hypothetical protein
VKYAEEVIVSPASGKRGVTETISAFREPMTRIVGGILMFWVVNEGLEL